MLRAKEQHWEPVSYAGGQAVGWASESVVAKEGHWAAAAAAVGEERS